jgi:hypothetical protein
MSMIPNYAETGKPVPPSLFNRLLDAVRASQVLSMVGGRVSRSSGGTTLTVDQGTAAGGGGGAVEVCAFKVTDASEGETVQVQVAFGTINDRVPDGMVLGEPYLLPVSDSGFVYAVLVFDPVTLVLSLDPGSVTLSYETEAQANTATVQYILLGVVTVTDGVISEVYSVCTQPVANPCQLAWEEPV